MKALFVRTVTTDRPEAVQIAFKHLSEAENYSECITRISNIGTGFDGPIKRDDDISISLDLMLGGTRLPYCYSRRHYHQCK